MKTPKDALLLIAVHAAALADARATLRNAAIHHGGAASGLDPRGLDRDIVGVCASLGLGDLFSADLARGARPLSPEGFREKWETLDEPVPTRRSVLRPLMHNGPATPGQKRVRGRSKPRALPRDVSPVRSAPTLITIEEAPHE